MGDYLGSVALPSMKMRQKKLCQIRQQPRAAPVYNDSNNFGVRMLEKLGWSEGKGLGKREDGMSAPIMPKIKQDIEGLGYAGEKDDHWAQHDQDFNQLLKSLNGGDASAENEVDLIKMKSLEEKSKNSRARVHYKKFTRGKDLSRASEKDLANIFGKKTLDDVKIQTVVAGVEHDNIVQGYEQEPDESNVIGLTTIKASMSLQDYFKSKMQEKFDLTKTNHAIYQNSRTTIESCDALADLDDEKDVSESSKINTYRESNNFVFEEPKQEEPRTKKSKKVKRSKNIPEELNLHGNDTKTKKEKIMLTEHSQQLVLQTEEQPVKKKSKKNKLKYVEELDSTTLVDQQLEEKNISASEGMLLENSAVASDTSNKKKRRKVEDKSVAQNVDEGEITCRVKVSVLKQLDESGFPGSNFADIVGYGLSQEVKLIKRESHRKKNLEKHQFIRQKQTSFQRKRQMLKKLSAFKRI